MIQPEVGFIAGQTAPSGKRMGHADAIVEGVSGGVVDYIKAPEAVSVKVAGDVEDIPSFRDEIGNKAMVCISEPWPGAGSATSTAHFPANTH